MLGNKTNIPRTYGKLKIWRILTVQSNRLGVTPRPSAAGLESLAGGPTGSMSSGDHSRRLERRWAPRYSFHADLEIEWGSALIRGRTRDISSNGMFIESNDPLWVGAGFTARLGLEKPVKVDCFVKRVEPGRGMGVAVTVPEEQQQRYRELLSSLSSNLP
jgi:hypothetical protein